MSVEFSLFVIALVALLPSISEAVGCGEPVVDSSCTDWQCTRTISVQSENNNSMFCVRGLAEGTTGCIENSDCYRNLACVNGTCINSGTGAKKPWLGFAGASVAVICFGSNFLPVKRLETGNGIFYQFVMGCGILFVGIAVQLIRNNWIFYPPAMLGGMMWAIGNTVSVPVIQCIGMGLGLATWGSTNMVMGWASGKFGIWGVAEEAVKIEWLSYFGIGIALLAISVFSLIKPSTLADKPISVSGEGTFYTDLYQLNRQPNENRFSTNPTVKRVLGFVGALGAGACYGVNFDPAQAMMDHYEQKTLSSDVEYSPDGLDYVFSHFTGIFLTATSVTVIFYSIQKRLPTVFSTVDHASILVPAFVSGVIWAIACTSWFVANTNLGLVVSFPSVCLGPSIVGNLWGIFLYREISGWRNLSLLCLAFTLVAASCACTVIAKGV